MAEKHKMTVTEALKKQGILEDRIDRAITEAQFCVATKKSEKNAMASISKEDFKKNAIASYQEITDLIAHKEAMKRAIVLSNAITEVVIAGKKMTVAEAIDHKRTINYQKTLLEEMKAQYTTETKGVDFKNTAVDREANLLVANVLGKEKESAKPTDIEAIIKPYRERNEYELIDPLNLKNKIETLEREIEDFESNVDTALQITNCSTWIEFEA